MDELLTTKQVQELFKVDRITVYRMLNDGRIKGVKVGNQWRFEKSEISRLLGGSTDSENVRSVPLMQVNDFPVDCVEHLQGIFAGILGVGAVSVNLGGEPLTEPVISNPFCKKMLENPLTRDACKESWRKITLKTKGNPGFHVCHAGLCYLRSAIKMGGDNVAWMITGQFYISQQSAEKTRAEIMKVAEKYQFDANELGVAAAKIPRLKAAQQQQVLQWAPRVTETVQSMLCERSDLVNRLEKIAEISAIHPSLKNNSEKGE